MAKGIIDFLINRNLLKVFKLLYRRKAIILMYHGLREESEKKDDKFVQVDKFRDQLDYLRKNYKIVSLDNIVNEISNGAVPNNSLAVTFDDGYEDNYRHLLPIAREFGIPVSVFLATDLVGRENYLSWDEVKQMRESGVSFGAHSLSHPHLSDLNEREISESKKVVEGKTGVSTGLFSYPYGEFNPKTADEVKKAGYKAALTTEYGLNDKNTDLFMLKRIPVNDNYSFRYFVISLFPVLRKLSRFLT